MLRTIRQLVLASHSPRRRSLLRDLGLSFTVCGAEIDEIPLAGEGVDDYVKRLARQKAEEVALIHPSAWVLAADTTVTIDGELLGKPCSPDQALAMLMRLAGRTHEVRTGYCLVNKRTGTAIIDRQTSEVRFAHFGEELARAYVLTGEPMDKAGGYGIQGRGAALVESVSGSYTNVVGLPLAEIIRLLKENGVITER